MNRKLLAILLVFSLITACGGSSDDNVERLSKSDYETQLRKKGKEIGKLGEKMQKVTSEEDFKKTIDELSILVDETIALNGPKKLEDKEKAIDDALLKFKELYISMRDIGGDSSRLPDFYVDIAEIYLDLTTALRDYSQ